MTELLTEEIRKYVLRTKLLKKVLHDTRIVFSDVNSARCFLGTQCIPGELTEDEEQEIASVANSSPCFVVFGDSTAAKAAVVNRLLQRDILPTTFSTEPEIRSCRTLFFRYGTKNRMTYIDDDSVGDYIMVNPSRRSTKNWVSLQLGDVEIGQSDKLNGLCRNIPSADIQLRCSLLEAGARVTMASSVEDPRLYPRLYDLCIRDVSPVIVYALLTSSLKEQELAWLKYMRSRNTTLQIFFVIAPQAVGLNIVTSPYNSFSSPRTTTPNGNAKEADVVTPNGDVSIRFATTPNGCGKREIDDTPNGCFSITSNGDVTPTGDVKPEYSTSDNTKLNGDTVFVTNQNDHTEIGVQSPSFEMQFSGDETLSIAQAESLAVKQQLIKLEFSCEIRSRPEEPLTPVSSTGSNGKIMQCDSPKSEILESFDHFGQITLFVKNILLQRLIAASSLINVVHVRCLEMMIALAHSMQRDVLCTPTKLKFAKDKEEELYRSLLDMTRTKQEEIRQIIIDVIAAMRDELIDAAAEHQFAGLTIPESGFTTTAKDLKICTTQIQELVLSRLNMAIAEKLASSIDILRESCTGVLTRTLQSLEQNDVEEGERAGTSKALGEIMNAAYRVEIHVCTGASFVKMLIEKMKQLMQSVMSSPRIDSQWKRKVAADTLEVFSDTRCQRLACCICAQIQECLKRSHQSFGMSMRRLELRHTDRLGRTVEQREKVAKRYAPRVARLSLESRSLRDLITYGKPVMGPEVGRGQYGVVYSCDSWGGFGPCAVKSVVPPDDKHWNDLAMEFYYYKIVPEHDRIVALRGSIIDNAYTGGGHPAALLIMDRLKWDLYTALEQKLDWLSRLQVSLDVIEGIRFLHSQGLVHRDVKLKNVLLDDNNRGKLTDLGFCKPEAMMSGSVVGTPIHMAPELFSGKYDHSVDLYAFGILFWYVCTGSVRLPRSFDSCPSKEMLWMSVKTGLRPEKPPNCDNECWDLMSSCWHGNPEKRPLVGEVETILRGMLTRYSSARITITPNSWSTSSLASDANLSDSDADET